MRMNSTQKTLVGFNGILKITITLSIKNYARKTEIPYKLWQESNNVIIVKYLQKKNCLRIWKRLNCSARLIVLFTWYHWNSFLSFVGAHLWTSHFNLDWTWWYSWKLSYIKIQTTHSQTGRSRFLFNLGNLHCLLADNRTRLNGTYPRNEAKTLEPQLPVGYAESQVMMFDPELTHSKCLTTK